MPVRPTLALLALSATIASIRADPATGDTRAAVEAELGKPTATRTTPSGDITAVYPRGTVVYRDDKAAELKLISADAWRARIEADKRASEEARQRLQRLAAERARRLAEANKARDALLADESFKQLSTEGRLLRVEQLLAAHPEAEVTALRDDLARTVIAARAEEKRLADERAAQQASDRRVETLQAKLDDTLRALTALAERAESLEKRLVSAEKENKSFHDRLTLMEGLVRTRVTSPGDGVGFTPAVNVGGGHSDSGPSH